MSTTNYQLTNRRLRSVRKFTYLGVDFELTLEYSVGLGFDGSSRYGFKDYVFLALFYLQTIKFGKSKSY